MSAKAISEYTGKELLYRHLEELEFVEKPQALKLTSSDSFDVVTDKIEWLTHDKVSAKSKTAILFLKRMHYLILSRFRY